MIACHSRLKRKASAAGLPPFRATLANLAPHAVRNAAAGEAPAGGHQPVAAALAALALLLGAMPVAAAPANSAPSAQQIDSLAQIILATLRGNGANGRLGDLEARLSFAVDQAQASCSTSQAALARVEGMSASLTPTARRALRSLRDSVSRCQKTNTGTAALRNTQSTLTQGTTLGLAGGTSNYQSAR